MFSKILSLFSVGCYAASDDKLVDPATVNFNAGAALVLEGLVGTTKFKNIVGTIEMPFNDSICARKKIVIVYSRTSPVGDVDYASLPMGSMCLEYGITSTAVSSVVHWLKNSTGWVKALVGGSTLASCTATVAGEFGRMWGTNSATTGTIRGLSVRTAMTGTGTQDGESLGAYTLISGTITGSGVHGAHITAQCGAEDAASTGACTGEVSGVRATIGIGLTNTAANLGTLAAIKADTYFQSSAAAGNSAFIRMADISTYGVDAILRLGTIVSRTTSKTTMTAAYAYVSGGMTVGLATAALKVVTPDGAFYIPLLAASALT